MTQFNACYPYRFDETYSRNRRVALQSYLRTVLRAFEFYEKQELFTGFLLIPPAALKVDNNAQYVQQTPLILDPFGAHRQIDFSEEDPYGSFSYRTYSDTSTTAEGLAEQQQQAQLQSGAKIKATIAIDEGDGQKEEMEQVSDSDSDDER